MSSSFIQESAIYQKPEMVKKDKSKAIFRMTLQTLDDINSNKRMYPSSVVSEALQKKLPQMKRRSFFGELDHPFPTGQSQFDAVRQTTVSLKDVSHIITDFEIRGKLVIGQIETTRNQMGMNLFKLLEDKIGIGMSMRGVADVERKGNYTLVKAPLSLISYDSVSLPSHISAVVDFENLRFESKQFITENAGLICKNGKCYLPEYFQELIDTKVVKFMNRWI